MFRPLLISAVGFLLAQPVVAVEYQCLTVEKVQISELHPPIHLAESITRADSVVLKLPVNCQSKKLLQPTTEQEAVDWLDAALPMDLKRGVLKGTYISLYANSNYGSSTEEDLSSRLSSLWNLKNKEFCSKIHTTALAEVPEASCFFKLLNKWREYYGEGIPNYGN